MLRKEIGLDGTERIVEMTTEEIAAFNVSMAQDEVYRQALFATLSYSEKRGLSYPPITEYLDGVVKGDQAQIDKYIADCLAVKAAYPKE